MSERCFGSSTTADLSPQGVVLIRTQAASVVLVFANIFLFKVFIVVFYLARILFLAAQFFLKARFFHYHILLLHFLTKIGGCFGESEKNPNSFTCNAAGFFRILHFRVVYEIGKNQLGAKFSSNLGD